MSIDNIVRPLNTLYMPDLDFSNVRLTVIGDLQPLDNQGHGDIMGFILTKPHPNFSKIWFEPNVFLAEV